MVNTIRIWPKSRRIVVGCLIVGTLAFVGCERNVYKLELTPDGDVLSRKLQVHREEAGDSPDVRPMRSDELQQIAAAYGQTLDQDQLSAAEQHEFITQFAEQVPNDIGGSGQFLHWETPLGSTSVYVERFRGRDDPAGAIADRLAAVDEIIRHVLTWLNTVLPDDQNLPALRRFVNDDLRRDLKNLSVYAWTLQLFPEDDESTQQEIGVRAAQYLVEREYVSLDSLPALARGLDSDDPTEAIEAVRSLVDRKLQLKMPLSKRIMQLLNDPDALDASFNDYARTTPEYLAILKTWENQPDKDPEAKPPQPSEILSKPVETGIGGPFLQTRDKVEIELAAPTKPILTNGQWDHATSKVTWNHSVDPSDAELPGWPAFAFAVWTEPDEATQQEIFGRGALTGEKLATYCFWHQALTPQEADNWDAQVGELRPTANLAEQIELLALPGKPDDAASEAMRGTLTAALEQQ